MTIDTQQNGDELVITLSGRLDTATSPLLEAELKRCIDGVKSLVLDFSSIEYISSAGLSVLLQAQKAMNRQGKMVVRNVNDMVMNVFEITGFSDILTIEQGQ